MAHNVIYIPGLGDFRPHGQDKILKLWKLFGLNVHYFPLGWADKEPFEPKFKRLLAKIDELQGQGKEVSLVGVSAGGSAVTNAYAARPNLKNVVIICGKIYNPQVVNPRYYINNPAFKDSLYKVPDSLKKLSTAERRRILSIHPITDGTVPPADTKIPGSIEKRVPAFGHIPGIYYTIIFAIPSIARFIKNQAK